MSSPHQLHLGSGGEYDGSLLPAKHSVNSVTDALLCSSVYNVNLLYCTVTSLHVLRESSECTGHINSCVVDIRDLTDKLAACNAELTLSGDQSLMQSDRQSVIGG